MGIHYQLAVAILREHRHRPFTGTILSIARQTVYMSVEQAIDLVTRELGTLPSVDPAGVECDRETRGGKEGENDRPFITDRAFYALFTSAQYRCLDVTDYEGADLVADLTAELDPGLAEQFDLIIDGSCLDNIFDPAMAQRNLARLLRPGGRIIQLERASRRPNVYVAFALSWFHDYYCINDFADCQVYLVQREKLIGGRWDLYHYTPVLVENGKLTYFGEDRYYASDRDAHALVVAEKGESSTWQRSPIQYGYRPGIEDISPGSGVVAMDWEQHKDDPYFRAAVRFTQGQRPMLVSTADKVPLPDEYFHYDPHIQYCGSLLPAPEL